MTDRCGRFVKRLKLANATASLNKYIANPIFSIALVLSCYDLPTNTSSVYRNFLIRSIL